MEQRTVVRTVFAVLLLAVGFAQAAEARWRDPKTGTWLTRDPLGTMNQAVTPDRVLSGLAYNISDPLAQYRDGMNLYQYAGSRPLYAVDRNGKWLIPVAIIGAKLAFKYGPKLAKAAKNALRRCRPAKPPTTIRPPGYQGPLKPPTPNHQA